MNIRQTIQTVLCAGLALAASACTIATNGPEQALSIQEEHPISVDSQVVTLTLSARDGLSDVDRARLKAFGRSYLVDGHGPISLTTPSGGGAEQTTTAFAASVRDELYAIGLSRDAMSTTSYAANSIAADDVILTYTKYVATPSACGVWSGLRERDQRNVRSPDFGCSTQNNLAAMIADPRDLVAMQPSADPDAEFRIRGVEAYRDGGITSSATDSQIEAQTDG